MSEYYLSFKPSTSHYGWHDSSAAIFKDGSLLHSVEEERFTREKHAPGTFPEEAIRSCLNHAEIELSDVSQIRLPYHPKLESKLFPGILRTTLSEDAHSEKLYRTARQCTSLVGALCFPKRSVINELENRFEGTVPEIVNIPHHKCHAASAFHPTNFDEALIVTIDGSGEFDSTVIWHGDESGLERIKTFKYPNSIGRFFGTITEFLGYYSHNGEGKIMGLAPYGERNNKIEDKLRNEIDITAEYDLTGIVDGTLSGSIQNLEELFQRNQKSAGGEFTQWEKDLAYVSQQLVETIVTNIVRKYSTKLNVSNVGLAGGVALNCKLNKKVEELSEVDDLFVQPVAHDGGLAIGAGYVGQSPLDVQPMNNVYYGQKYDNKYIKSLLQSSKVSFEKPDNLEKEVAAYIADGELVGWFQGRMEMGPRALGNRSILADPRTIDSRDRVNKYVKHREEWRPFAPSILEEAASEYLKGCEQAPYMIKTYDIVEEKRDDIQAVIHPADGTTRPQTVNEEQNTRYYKLIKEFEKQTGTPVLLNTSFNDHAEPIVNTPSEALKDFYGMGLDLLVLQDYLVKK